jgi:hypothetical protein
MGNQPSSAKATTEEAKKEVIRHRLDRLRDDLASKLRITVPDAFTLQRTLDELRDEIFDNAVQVRDGRNTTKPKLLLKFTVVPRKLPVVTADVVSEANYAKPAWEYCPKGTLKLYENTETGQTWIAHYAEQSGVMKMNIPVRGNVCRITKVRRSKRNNGGSCGTVNFFARATFESSHFDRFALHVNVAELDVLFGALVGMGASIENKPET